MFGNSGRNILRGPSLFRVDFSLVKGFQIRERTRLELQWEAYNAFMRDEARKQVASDFL